MFKKILIANRGEIACRIIKTATGMGIRCVAVYSDADKSSLHVELADQAFHIGSSPVSESYLRIDRIIEVAVKSGAQAIHPGYGLLSENPDLVKACDQAGIVFIGPGQKAIKAMGLKDAAKSLMHSSNVPIVPGYHGENQDAVELQAQAAQCGYPVLIKARAGGGGKGMRRVESADTFDSALEGAKREALSSFGDDHVIIEKFIPSPRHIEVQVFADQYGNTVHLFERDCSMQRRHQKVIEEAPAPGMTESLRAAMGEAAVRAAQAVDYVGAGTVEFIVDGSQGLNESGFYFMEMNTRLQVEHPVTELITGQDLVEWQIRVAQGEPLPLTQNELSIDGHAFEARIYAEDATNNFMPATGELEYLSLPDVNARVDSGVRQGDAISPYYDPMIAKVIVHGSTRDKAISQLQLALTQTHIVGCVTNVDFLMNLVNNQSLISGQVNTHLIDRHYESLIHLPKPCGKVITIATLAALGYFEQIESKDPWQILTGWRHFTAAKQYVLLKWQDKFIEATLVVHADKTLELFYDDQAVKAKLVNVDARRVSLDFDGDIVKSTVITNPASVTVFFDSNSYRFKLYDNSLGLETESDSDNKVISPMPGLITSVSVENGQQVNKDDVLVVMEAMKMEHSLTAQMSGTVANLTLKKGDQISEGFLILKIEEVSEVD